jgi:hypothetical protein
MWDGQRDGVTKSTLRIKEQEKHLPLNKHDDDDEVYSPTNIMGASGQWCLISGYHFDVTFSKEDGLVTLKQIRNTSV